MFYKELLNMRLKLVIWIIAYGFVTWHFHWISGVEASKITSEGITYADSVFEPASMLSAFITLFVAILGGVDLKTRSRETLNSLRTPSPNHLPIYVRTLLINLAGWVSIYLINAIGLMVIMGVSSSEWVLVGLVILLGTFLMTLSGLVSVLTNSTAHSLLTSFEIVVGICIILGGLFVRLHLSLERVDLLAIGLMGLGVVATLWLTAGKRRLVQTKFLIM